MASLPAWACFGSSIVMELALAVRMAEARPAGAEVSDVIRHAHGSAGQDEEVQRDASAKSLKGDDRKAFLSEYLKTDKKM